MWITSLTEAQIHALGVWIVALACRPQTRRRVLLHSHKPQKTEENGVISGALGEISPKLSTAVNSHPPVIHRLSTGVPMAVHRVDLKLRTKMATVLRAGAHVRDSVTAAAAMCRRSVRLASMLCREPARSAGLAVGKGPHAWAANQPPEFCPRSRDTGTGGGMRCVGAVGHDGEWACG